MREGKFDNLPGAGRPINLAPMPAEENARMTWWALKILRQNDVIPDEVKWRKRIERLKALLSEADDERTIRLLIAQINQLVRKLNTLGTNAMNLGIAPLSLETELEQRRLAPRRTPLPRCLEPDCRRC